MGLFLHYGGDLLWVLALAIMASMTQAAMRRIPRGELTPPLWGGPRVPRDLALMFTPVVGFVIGAGLWFLAVAHGFDDEQAVIIFGARALLASLFALAHLSHLKGALTTLEAEGKLLPPR